MRWFWRRWPHECTERDIIRAAAWAGTEAGVYYMQCRRCGR